MPIKVNQVVILARYVDENGRDQIMEQQLFDVLDFRFDQSRDEGLLSTTLHVVSGKKVAADD